jgi:ZIP family zinc transporter
VLGHGVEPVETAVSGHNWSRVAELAPLLAGGLAVGLMSLVYYDRWMTNKRATPLVGPGAAAVDEFTSRSWIESLTPGRRLALLIATGIGLHNFGEGLAIGQAAAADEVSLALVLIIGFALHNATEGFGIVGPMSGESERPSWGFLALMGLIGGGPTFVGTVIGQAWVSEALGVVFFALAAGSILYVVIQLLEVCRRHAMPVVVAWWILAGLVLGFATDFVLVAAGA